MSVCLSAWLHVCLYVCLFVCICHVSGCITLFTPCIIIFTSCRRRRAGHVNSSSHFAIRHRQTPHQLLATPFGEKPSVYNTRRSSHTARRSAQLSGQPRTAGSGVGARARPHRSSHLVARPSDVVYQNRKLSISASRSQSTISKPIRDSRSVTPTETATEELDNSLIVYGYYHQWIHHLSHIDVRFSVTVAEADWVTSGVEMTIMS